MAAAIILSLGSLFAQGGERQQMTPEDRAKQTVEKMVDLKLEESVREKTLVIMTEFFQGQQQAMQDMRASGNMDREAMRTKRKELSDARDAKLKMIFTQPQMQQWIDVVEPSLRPQRGSGGRPTNG